MLTRQNLFGKREETPPARPPLTQNRPATLPASKPEPIAAAGSPPAAPEVVRVEKSKAETVTGNRLIVGPDVKLKGAEILDCDTLVVEGRVEATMDSRVIHIAEHGSFSGTVSIDVAEIHGSFDGELIARSQLLIHSTGRVNGKIRYGKILIDEGGQLSGDVQSLGTEESSRPARTEAIPVLNMRPATTATA